jgi:1-acyl-sn-glycerol-3-phosphate acyltransferase
MHEIPAGPAVTYRELIARPASGPRPGVLTRLHFAWVGLWVVISTLFMAPSVVINHQFTPTAETFKKWAARWSGWVLAFGGIRVRTEVRAVPPQGKPAVFVANHQSALDILTLSVAIPHPFGFMAKASLRKAPLVGWVIASTACLFVDRSDARRAVQSIRVAGERIRNGNSVLIFCEGERTWSPRLSPFLKGAFHLAVEAGVPLIPVTVIDNYRVADERVFASRPGVVHCVIGKPISMEGVTRQDLPALMERVRVEMEAELARGHAA